MAYHESHERNCPYCDARISATAPKCLNCGEYVDDADDEAGDDAQESERPPLAGVMVGVGIALASAALLIYICFVRT